jgi:hypothetical protein
MHSTAGSETMKRPTVVLEPVPAAGGAVTTAE